MSKPRGTGRAGLGLGCAIAVIASFAVATSRASADEVLSWNATASDVMAAGGKNAIVQSRIFAMTQAAVHDALNAIDRRYQPYAFDGAAAPGASPEAAIAAAARDVLLHEVPAQAAAIATAYSASLGAIADGPPKDQGVAVGQAAAAAVIALRAIDGSTAIVPYTPGTGAGVWQPTPNPPGSPTPGLAPAVLPGWGQVTPFALDRGDQFRPDAPYSGLGSHAYTRDYNEVKTSGSYSSTARGVQGSEIARFWYEGSPAGWNRIGRNLAARSGLRLWEEARLLGLLNFAMADGFIAGFDAKYTYNFWRPVTAIRAGDTDGNDATDADPSWNSYLSSPAIPDFPSTHSILGSAAAVVLTRFFGDDRPFTTTSGAPFPGITRSFSSFSAAARENGDSRVLAGIHFRTAVTVGLRQGEQIGHFVFRHALRRAAEAVTR